MNVPDFYVKTWESEMPAFGRVLRALPQDKLDYSPHERSTASSRSGIRRPPISASSSPASTRRGPRTR